MIRILIAEDSLTTRALLREILSSDPDLQVIGQAKNGVEAVELTRKLRPDLVTMDIHMPDMDGLTATKEIMIVAPTPTVIITGSSAAREVELSMHALRAGALDVIAKPPGPGSPGFEEAAQKLIATIKAMAQVKVVRHYRPRTLPTGRTPRTGNPGRIVAIATSTGGPAALQRLLADLPGDFNTPILVVQHITKGFAAGLANWLNSVCDLQVKLAEQGEPLVPHTVYLAPDDRHLGVSAPGAVALSSAPPIGGFRPSGTFLFTSSAQVYGPAVVAVILTGMGQDGVEGLRAVRQAGGRILAQDEKSCVVFGMPGAAVAAGVVDQVLSPDAIASRLVDLVTNEG
jgi:two-component system, chemotaxis family, protein-glutamate methylesterase/glutaminase